MRRKQLFFVVVFTFLIALPVLAQEKKVEYGNSSELRDVQKIFVDTGTDIELRNRIVSEIHKRLPGLAIASIPEDARIHWYFL
jgi:hypothetical protein